MKIRVCAVFILLTSSLCAEKKYTPKPTWMTVYIHGATAPRFATQSLMKVFRDDIENTIYSRAVEAVRTNSIFHQAHAMKHQGFHSVDIEHPAKDRGASALASIHKQIAQKYHVPSENNLFYTFGWTGRLSYKEQFQESEKLYDHLKQEISNLKKQGHKDIRVRLLGYSRGGHVSLNLAAVRQKRNDENPPVIDELIFLGVPIQEEIDYLVADPMFKQVYNFYSTGDRVQTFDILSKKHLFSRRRFTNRANFAVPKNLKEINLKVVNYDVVKIQSTKKKNAVIKTARKQFKNKTTYHPGHIELWYFGWTPQWYRQNFPLHPLPFVAFLPFIANAIEKEMPDETNLEVTIYPQKECFTLGKRKSTKRKTVEFVDHEDFEYLKKHALSFVPDGDPEIEHAYFNDRALHEGLCRPNAQSPRCQRINAQRKIDELTRIPYY